MTWIDWLKNLVGTAGAGKVAAERGPDGGDSQIFSLFEAMGAYGLLLPLLAAWAPNLLFGATGMLLLLTIRT